MKQRKEVLNTIVEPEKSGDIICLTDLQRSKNGTEKFSFYLETRGILKELKTYRVIIQEI